MTCHVWELQTINPINPSIQLIMECSKNAIPFLDILIKPNNDKIWMNIYYKPTDAHRCLPFSSNHPNHCKKNIPLTLARRICTIVQNTEAKMKHLENLKMNLSKYQYPKQLTGFGINKALSIPLQKLHTPKTTPIDNSLPFITTYNRNNSNVYEMMDKSVEYLKRNKVGSFENLRVIKSKQQAPSLKKILSKVVFSQKQVGVFKCPDKQCDCCTSLLLGNSYTFKNVDSLLLRNSYTFKNHSRGVLTPLFYEHPPLYCLFPLFQILLKPPFPVSSNPHLPLLFLLSCFFH